MAADHRSLQATLALEINRRGSRSPRNSNRRGNRSLRKSIAAEIRSLRKSDRRGNPIAAEIDPSRRG
jgi:hypothetical protein